MIKIKAPSTGRWGMKTPFSFVVVTWGPEWASMYGVGIRQMGTLVLFSKIYENLCQYLADLKKQQHFFGEFP